MKLRPIIDRDRGVALITAMLILFLATATVVTMASRQRGGLRLDTTLTDRVQADEYAHGLVRWAMRQLREDTSGTDSEQDGWAAPLPPTQVRGGTVEAGIIDLGGRFNLNNLMPVADDAGGSGASGSARAMADTPSSAGGGSTSHQQQTDNDLPTLDEAGFSDVYDFIPPDWLVKEYIASKARRHAGGTSVQPLIIQDQDSADSYRRRFERLLRQLGLRPELADAIQDWLDADVDVRYPGGAEDDYYLGRSPAYRAANRPFTDVSELLLVRGVSLDAYRRLRPYVSALPVETPVNINTAPAAILKVLSPDMDEALVTGMIVRRRARPFGSVEELEAFVTARGGKVDAHGLAVSSSFYQVQGRVVVGDFRQRYRISLMREDDGEVSLLGWGDG